MTEYIDRMPTMTEYAAGKRIDPKLTEYISRADAIEAVESLPNTPNGFSDTYDKAVFIEILEALPSADAVHKPDYSYEADMVRRLKESRSADAVPQMEHDREWIIGCIKHDGFIKTDRFDKANQIILDALSAEAETKCVAQIKVDTEEVVRRIKEEYDITDGWIPCSERLPNVGENVLFTTDIYGGYVAEGDRRADGKWWQYRWNSLLQNDEVIAWMPLPKPYREDGEEE